MATYPTRRRNNYRVQGNHANRGIYKPTHRLNQVQKRGQQRRIQFQGGVFLFTIKRNDWFGSMANSWNQRLRREHVVTSSPNIDNSLTNITSIRFRPFQPSVRCQRISITVHPHELSVTAKKLLLVRQELYNKGVDYIRNLIDFIRTSAYLSGSYHLGNLLYDVLMEDIDSLSEDEELKRIKLLRDVVALDCRGREAADRGDGGSHGHERNVRQAFRCFLTKIVREYDTEVRGNSNRRTFVRFIFKNIVDYRYRSEDFLCSIDNCTHSYFSRDRLACCTKMTSSMRDIPRAVKAFEERERELRDRKRRRQDDDEDRDRRRRRYY